MLLSPRNHYQPGSYLTQKQLNSSKKKTILTTKKHLQKVLNYGRVLVKQIKKYGKLNKSKTKKDTINNLLNLKRKVGLLILMGLRVVIWK